MSEEKKSKEPKLTIRETPIIHYEVIDENGDGEPECDEFGNNLFETREEAERVSRQAQVLDPCVHCGKSTAVGSGRFVNRIPADADYESKDEDGNVVYKDGEYRDGYSCPHCAGPDCWRCDKSIYIDEDITPEQCGLGNDLFSDGARWVHLDCLTTEEKGGYDKENDNG